MRTIKLELIMNKQEKKQREELKKKVLAFVEVQPDYFQQPCKITFEDDRWAILYGDNLLSGVAGFGNDPESAFNDFIENWNWYKKKEPQQ